jgi:serine/threonine-protein kinase RsbW
MNDEGWNASHLDERIASLLFRIHHFTFTIASVFCLLISEFCLSMMSEVVENETASRRVMSSLPPENFVGRDDEMRRLVGCVSFGAQKTIVLAAPLAGASELLKQVYDHLFIESENFAPVYFAWSRADRSVTNAAARFLYEFLLQLLAYRRRDAALINAAPLWSDIAELFPPHDAEVVRILIEDFTRARAADDERALRRIALGAPRRLAADDLRSILLFDDAHLIETLDGVADAQSEFARMFTDDSVCYVFSGVRRRLLDALYAATDLSDLGAVEKVPLDALNEADARRLVEHLAREYQVSIGTETRDLLVEQTRRLPALLNMMLRAARARNTELNSFLACQRLYVDELLGGRINRRFQTMLEEAAGASTSRRALLRALYEELISMSGKSTAESWQRRLNLSGEETKRVLRELNAAELVSVSPTDAPTVVENGTLPVWRDAIRAAYRLNVAAEARALVVAETLSDVLKRAPQTMARAYRQQRAFNLRQLLAQFDCQRIPASLLNFERFVRLAAEEDAESLAAALDADAELARLPQIISVATAASFYPPMSKLCDAERAVVAHGFDGMTYASENEVTWLAVEIEAKQAVGRAAAEVWFDRLAALARRCDFKRPRFLLVAAEGFTPDASAFFEERAVMSASRRQLEILAARLAGRAFEIEKARADEFELILPMSENAELVAAQTIEHFARRMNFAPSAINQIKTAVVEACINAAEHSLSPERKIYLRFRAEHDKLIITVASRGLNAAPQDGERERQATASATPRTLSARRGWGLQLIRALMDEVEFERVDDGTRLRMVKRLRASEAK